MIGYILFIILCGLGLAYGALEYFAGAMSDNPSAGEEAGRNGLWVMAISLGIGVAITYLHFVKGVS